MHYAAYQARHDGTDFSFTGRDDVAGILGTFSPGGVPPVVTGDTLDEVRIRARAHLGEEPGAFLYLTDADGRVYEIMINVKHHRVTEAANRRTAITGAILLFCITCLLATAFGLGAWLAILGFLGAGCVYCLILRVRLFNEIEGAVICEIFLILGLLLIPAIKKATGE